MSASTRSKGQSSLEFIAMLSFMMLAFSGFYTFFVNQQIAAVQNQRAVYAEAVADKAAFELDLALAQGDGFSRNFTLPESLGGADYNITVRGEIVLLEWGERQVLSSTAAPEVQGNLTPGGNRVENRGGVLYVS
ncbi:MAG: hypothetical protein ABEJ62_01155 [Candidatus Nanohaloarchaea archaeon]